MNISEIKAVAQEGKLDRPKDYYSISYLFHRRISIYVSVLFSRISPPLTPNMVTFAAIVLSNAGYVLFASLDGYVAGAVALSMCYMSFLLDKVDGELARLKNIISYRGKYLDELYHFMQPLLYMAIAMRAGGVNSNITVVLLTMILLIWGRFRIQLTRPTLLRFMKRHAIETTGEQSGLLWKSYRLMRFLIRYDVVLVQAALVSLVLEPSLGAVAVSCFLYVQFLFVIALELFATIYDLFVRAPAVSESIQHDPHH